MLTTLTGIFCILLLPGLLVKGNLPCPGDTSIVEVRQTFYEYNVGLISFPTNLPILKVDV